MTFTGFRAEAFDFYDGLVADNTKAYWSDHKDDYQRLIREPYEQLALDVSDDFGEGHIYRPYRDLRFSKDKTPYKDHQGMYVEMRNGIGWYVQLNRDGLMIAGGWYMASSEQIQRFRRAVDSPRADELEALVASTTTAGFTIDGDQLKTRPRGVDPQHPRLHLLRYKSIYAHRQWEPAAWMGTRECGHRIREGWSALTPLMGWLADVAGPGEKPVGSRRGKGRTDTSS